jgi:ABC-type transporter Mla MlaB component
LYDGGQRAIKCNWSKKTVLKITTTQDENKSLRVHLCGQLTGEYVSELEKALKLEHAEKVALDMSNVTFVDRQAMVFLCGVKSRISIENIPSYVTRWIEQEGRCGPSHRESSEK